MENRKDTRRQARVDVKPSRSRFGACEPSAPPLRAGVFLLLCWCVYGSKPTVLRKIFLYRKKTMAVKRRSSSYRAASKRRKLTRAIGSRRNRRRFYKRSGKAPVYTKILRQPVPDRIFSQFTYCDNYNFTIPAAGSAGLTSQAWWTSMYDPDYSGLGHQPLWYDQVAPMWSRYRVYGIKYILEAMNTNTNQLATCVIQHSNDIPESAAAGFNTIRERRNSRTYTLTSANGRPIRIKGYMSTYKPWGMTKTDYIGDEGFEAVVGATPTKCAYLNSYWVTQNTSCAINLQVRLVYYVELFQRKNVGGS